MSAVVSGRVSGDNTDNVTDEFEGTVPAVSARELMRDGSGTLIAIGSFFLLVGARSILGRRRRGIVPVLVGVFCIGLGVRSRRSMASESSGPPDGSKADAVADTPHSDDLDTGAKQTDEKEVSDDAHAARERPDLGRESETDVEGAVHDSPVVEPNDRKQADDEDPNQNQGRERDTSTDTGTGTGTGTDTKGTGTDTDEMIQPEETDTEDDSLSYDDAGVSDVRGSHTEDEGEDEDEDIDLSDTALAEEPAEATGPDAVESDPAQTTVSKPEMEPADDVSLEDPSDVDVGDNDTEQAEDTEQLQNDDVQTSDVDDSEPDGTDDVQTSDVDDSEPDDTDDDQTSADSTQSDDEDGHSPNG